MKRLSPIFVLLLLALFPMLWAEKGSPEKGGSPRPETKLNGHKFALPEGFVVELAAGSDLVPRPITADFDEQGRLYVTDSSGFSEKASSQLEKRPHRIVRLEDTDGDGRFDKSVVFADKMMFPEGTLWYNGSLYVAAPPSIWKLTDTDGDGVADERSEWFMGKTLTGCANDLHGPYLGPDGWIYWCKGAWAQQTHETPGKKPFVTRASHIFRCRPDGSGIEPVMTGGMDNPVDVAFTPGGDRIFTTTFLQHPGGGKRDGLIHAVYGGVYGKDHDVINDHKRTSPSLMPILTHLGPAAPCGLTSYDSTAFGDGYRHNLFACLFNMQKVTRHTLEVKGASYSTIDEDFLVSDQRDFHPTDIVEDADGSLLVIDTGGWYKMCCPTSQLHKPDILGGIYRVRRKGAVPPQDPRGLKLVWDRIETRDLIARLEDPRLAVQRRAIHILGSRGNEVVPALREVVSAGKTAELRRNAVWTATRIETPSAREAVRAALGDRDAGVRQVALHSISLHRDREAVPTLIELLKHDSFHHRRVSAEALARIQDKRAVPALLQALEELSTSAGSGEPDRNLEHALTFALIEIGDREGTTVGLKHPNARVRRNVLIALDQMDGNLDPANVAGDLTARDPVLRETAWWLVSRHLEWAKPLENTLRTIMNDEKLSAGEQEDVIRQLARFSKATTIQQLLVERIRESRPGSPDRTIALKAMAQSGLRQVPDSWIDSLQSVLDFGTKAEVPEAVAAIRVSAVPKAQGEKLLPLLLRLAEDSEKPADLRLNALSAVPGGLPETTPSVFGFLTSRLDKDLPVSVRTQAANVLARAKLTGEQLSSLVPHFRKIGPMEAERLVEAFAQTNDEKVGMSLVAALKESPARTGMRADTIERSTAKCGPKVQTEVESLCASLNEDTGKQKARLDQMLGMLKDGDIRRGQAVFNSTKAACASCHAIGYLGGNIGPDLTRIGQIRSERDLLESIVFPSASFVQGYQPVQIATRSGKVHNGLVRRENTEEVVLAVNATEEVRIRRQDIEEMQPGKLSIMPAGLDQQLTPQELADLVTFLRACK